MIKTAVGGPLRNKEMKRGDNPRWENNSGHIILLDYIQLVMEFKVPRQLAKHHWKMTKKPCI
ncbi:hypothetical protein CW304_25760 [Bacillus sp. UFRGS-B20]|nr:hypothetical protein CW304_25760 [Bacillus sp. UFRGS-B20]